MAGTRKGTTPKPAPKDEPKAASIDFSALEAPETIAADEIRHTRTTKLDRSPVLEWLQESWDTDTGKRQALPSDEQADEFIKLLRSGVNRLGFGLRVRKVAGSNGSVVVEYAAVERRERKSKEA